MGFQVLGPKTEEFGGLRTSLTLTLKLEWISVRLSLEDPSL